MAKETVNEVVDVEGTAVYRTTIVVDETVADLEIYLASMDEQIVRATDEHIGPLQAARNAIAAKITALE